MFPAILGGTMFFKSNNTQADSISDSIHRDITATLYGTLAPIALMAVALMVVGGIAAWQTGDAFVAYLTATGLILSIIRTFDVMAFRRRVARKPPLGRPEGVRWELRYAIGSFSSGLIIGLFAARCIFLGDDACSAMATGLAFGFGAGVVARLSLRPLVAVLGLGSTGIPIIVAIFLQPLDAAHAGLGIMFMIYFAGSFEMVRQSYNANLLHITLKREFEQLARRDAMTGLFNRTALSIDLARLVTDRRAGMIAVHAIDLDHFKAANDKFGHPVGDALLGQVAVRLKSLAADEDVLIRMGGDEFIFAQNMVGSPDEAEAMARRIFETVSAPYCIEENDIVIGASIGVAVSPADGRSVEALLARSDRALYQAKEFRGGYVMASDLGDVGIPVVESKEAARRPQAACSHAPAPSPRLS
jgi:diguanylate cyclase